MTLERDAIEAAFAAYREHSDRGDWNAWVDLFSEDCSFSAPYLTESIKGRENLRAFAAGWPNVTNRPEWVAIDGNRLVFAWNTRNDRMPSRASSFRGVTTLAFDANALICEFEEWFDTAAVDSSALSAVYGQPGR